MYREFGTSQSFDQDLMAQIYRVVQYYKFVIEICYSTITVLTPVLYILVDLTRTI
jgi:hypothetical protein